MHFLYIFVYIYAQFYTLYKYIYIHIKILSINPVMAQQNVNLKKGDGCGSANKEPYCDIPKFFFCLFCSFEISDDLMPFAQC